MGKKFLAIILLTLTLTTTSSYANNICNNYHIVVNKDNRLSADYVPDNLVMPNVEFYSPGDHEKNYMEETAARALEQMFEGAKQDGITLVAVSGYRSYNRQEVLYGNALSQHGDHQMCVAHAGASEHQTGLVMDVVGTSGHLLTQSFGGTPEGIWVAENCHKYGFIVRYLEGKEHITGVIYEPWHLRYVGEELATYCYTNHLVMEELVYCCDEEKNNGIRGMEEELNMNIRDIINILQFNVVEQVNNGTLFNVFKL